MSRESGNLSIHTENIFPIIKKWLYSEKDIFVRELVSNASDAVSKFNKLVSIGEAQAEGEQKYRIDVIVDKENKTLVFKDNGIGMTDEEVKKYINQIAFSGAQDFVEKYKDKTDDGQIIGHFGLGFYSAFMVAEKVRIDTLSYLPGAKAVQWESDGSSTYEMDASDRTERGTTITLFMMEDSQEFLEFHTLRGILEKYCAFMPYEIYLTDVEKVAEESKEKEGEEKEQKAPEPINETHPLWLKAPKDCTEEEYKAFYHKVFHDFNDPLFWIHLNMDYPFNFKGILYFPKLRHEFEMNEGQIKLFNNQVFVADNIKEVIPEFLLLLKGVLDCPDLPLNVSRSFLQNDGYVKKISAHITKKVADKLTGLYENERESYNKFWDDIHPFIKYGCMKEAKFFEKVKDILIYKTTKDDFATLKDYLERNKDKHENKVFYVSDEKQQTQYINLFKEHGMEAIILASLIDSHFITFLEMQENQVKFTRIDSDLSDHLKDEGAADDISAEELEKLFKTALGKENLKIRIESLKAVSIPAMILLSEESRRMQEMSRMFGGMDVKGMFPEEETLVLNKNNRLIRSVLKMDGEAGKAEDVKTICLHIYDLAMMSHKQLEPETMTQFIERSNLILSRLAEEEAK